MTYYTSYHVIVQMVRGRCLSINQMQPDPTDLLSVGLATLRVEQRVGVDKTAEVRVGRLGSTRRAHAEAVQHGNRGRRRRLT